MISRRVAPLTGALRSGGALLAARLYRSLPAALVFWGVSYAILTLRWLLLQDSSSDFASAKRAVSTLVGAGAFLIPVALRPIIEVDLRRRPLLTASVVLTAASVMLLARLSFGGLLRSQDHAAFAEELRTTLFWAGYFIAALFAWPAISRSSHGAAHNVSQETGDAAAPAEFWVQSQGLLIRVAAPAIDYVEAEGNYVRIHFAGKCGLMRTPLKLIETRLGAHDFVRIHRSIVCRRVLISAIRRRPSGAVTAVLVDGRELPVGRHYAGEIRPDATPTGR